MSIPLNKHLLTIFGNYKKVLFWIATFAVSVTAFAAVDGMTSEEFQEARSISLTVTPTPTEVPTSTPEPVYFDVGQGDVAIVECDGKYMCQYPYYQKESDFGVFEMYFSQVFSARYGLK